jgi:hypothetical protein
MESEQPLLTPAEAATFLHVGWQTLANWRHKRCGGPPFIKLGRAIRYDKDALLSWIMARTVVLKAE